MYLSQLTLDPRSRRVQTDVSNRYQLHRTVYSGFDESSYHAERVLYRMETDRSGIIRILVQSQEKPNWENSAHLQTPGVLLRPVEEKVFQPRLRAGMNLLFRLVANPTVKRNGKRWALRSVDEQTAWMMRKAAEHGFMVEELQISDEGDVKGWRGGERMIWGSVRFDGMLTVSDEAACLAAISQGIGSAKSFGFGLLTVAPAAR